MDSAYLRPDMSVVAAVGLSWLVQPVLGVRISDGDQHMVLVGLVVVHDKKVAAELVDIVAVEDGAGTEVDREVVQATDYVGAEVDVGVR